MDNLAKSKQHDQIVQRYLFTKERIRIAAESVGRNPAEVKLVVVTKSQPIEVIEAAISAGATKLGENYAEQAIPKMNSIGPRPGVEWHMIGHVQGRKASLVCQNFDWVHSLDRVKLADRLNRAAVGIREKIPVLIEVNLSGETSKSGWPVSNDDAWHLLITDIKTIAALPYLQVKGLMTMPPWSEDPESTRPYFTKLRRLRDFLTSHVPEVEWSELSMGTSIDYEVAIQEGATFVRIGEAILGHRQIKHTTI